MANTEKQNIEENTQEAKADEQLTQENGEADEKKPSEADYKAVIEDLNDKMLRAVAEAQNTKRRAEIDINNARSFSIESFAKDMLPVLDNLERALGTITEEETGKNPLLKNFKDGIEITRKEMLGALERNGVKQINPLGQQFDPNLHQAMAQAEDKKAAPGTVLNVMQTGYIIKERLLRPALVVTAKQVG